MTIETLLQEYDSHAGQVKCQLEGLLETVASGGAPTRESIAQANASLGGLREKYDLVVNAAAAQLPAAEMPQENAPAGTYLQAVREQASRLRLRLEDARSCLKRFLAICSPVAEYADALRPSQEKAFRLLSLLMEEGAPEPDALEAELAGPKALLRAVECEEKHSAKGIALCEQVMPHFSPRVYGALVANQLFIGQTEASAPEAAAPAPLEEAPAPEAAAPAVAAAAEEPPAPSPAPEAAAVAAPEAATPVSAPATPETANAPSAGSPNESAFVTALTAKKAFLDPDCKIGRMTEEKSEWESRKITASTFKNEMKGGSLAAEKEFIQAICHQTIVSPQYLTEVIGVPEKIADATITHLFQKGYLRRYGITPGGVFYCAAPRLIKALSYQDASRLVGVKRRDPNSWGEDIESSETRVASRVCFARVNDACVLWLPEKGARGYFEKSTQMTDAFVASIHSSHEPQKDVVFAGAFWCGKEECGQFLSKLTQLIEECAGAYTLVLAAWDKERAKGLAEALLPQLGDRLPEQPISLYSLSEDTYYAGPGLAPIQPGMVGSREQPCLELPQQVESEPDVILSAGEETVSGEDSAQPEEAGTMPAPEKPEPAGQEQAPRKDGAQLPPKEEAKLPAAPLPENEPPAAPLHKPQSDDPIRRMAEAPKSPSDEELAGMITMLLNEKVQSAVPGSPVAQALLLAKAASLMPGYDRCSALCRQLVLATRSPLDAPNKNPSDAPNRDASPEKNFSDAMNEAASPTIILSAYLLKLLVPGAPYDYSLKAQAAEYLRAYETYFPELPEAKNLFSKLNSVSNVIPMGFSEAVLARIGDDAETEKYIKGLQAQAKQLLHVSVPRTKLKALPSLYSSLFGKSSDLYDCLEIVSKNNQADIEAVGLVMKEYCDGQEDALSISEQKVGSILDAEWRKVNHRGASFDLGYITRPQVLRQLHSRLKVLKAWLDHVGALSGGKYDLGRIRTLRDELITLAQKALEELAQKKFDCKPVLLWALRTLLSQLENAAPVNADMFVELARSGVITLDENRLPVLQAEWNDIKYYEPWRTVLRHLLSPVESLEAAKNEILDRDAASELFDNLHQLELIGALLGEPMSSSESDLRAARETAQDNSKDFDDALELAFTYDRISELEKEKLAAIKHQHEQAFFERQDFGIWMQFLNALRKRMDELTEQKKAELKRRLDGCMPAGRTSPILSDARWLLERDLNFAVAEEYINRYSSGEQDFSEELQAVLHEPDHFAEFISDDVFEPLYNECFKRRENNFHTVARDYLTKHFPEGWTVRLKEDSLRLVDRAEKCWPIYKNKATASQMEALFRWLGLSVKGAEKLGGRAEEMFRIKLEPSPRSMADYRHPISAFGTQTKPYLYVVILHGNIPAKQLVDKITGLGLGEMSVVLLNYPIAIAVRRQIAEEFHKTTGENPFLLIDQTLALYLALHQVTERLPVMLKCTLPYTTYQPFVRDGGSTADEMFFGRSKELATIKDPNGACIVYGGRQLGKTALLERAESLCFKPENHAYAVYSNILSCADEAAIVQKVLADVNSRTHLSLGPCKTIRELCDEFEKLFGSKKVESMLLLLDETDRFLEAISGQHYAPLQPMIDLKRRTKNRFKFVLAGLHNVCRAKNATARNGVFGQLGTPLCIKPLSPTDALQLLSRPLRYLGFQIDRYPHLETILTNTNYYPGILQFFGYMLVETLSAHYGKYYRAVDGNPPYTLQDEQLGSVLNSADLNHSIRDKFRWSLELDPRYFMIARCIAVLYYFDEGSNNAWQGYSVGEIQEIAKGYEIRCLKGQQEGDYLNLLDEMVEMGILSRPDAEKERYRLRRGSFINIIGSDFDTVDADIKKNNQEVTA